MFQRTFLTGLGLTLLVVQACGSKDASIKAPDSGDAGQAGAAVGGEPSTASGGSSTTVGGRPDGGSPDGGSPVGGSPTDTGGDAGAAGEPSTRPRLELLFSVLGDGGLPGTDVAGHTAPHNTIFSSSTASQARLAGTNQVKVLGETLGLAARDPIMAFTLLSPEPENPMYVFSMGGGSEGGLSTRVALSESNGSTEEGDVYFSDGVPSYRARDEGGDQYGYNGLLAHQSSLGLANGSEGAGDNLTGLSIRDARVPLSEIYFTVGPASLGAPDSAVEAALDAERGCTVFRSELDGTNSVAFSCQDLGLVAGDQIDALLVYGEGAPSKVTFSVTYGAQGAAGSALAAAVLANSATGATLFQSTGAASNTLFKAASDLGLGNLNTDELDALAVFDAPPPTVAHEATCNLAFDPFDVAEGGLNYAGGASHIGPNVMVVFGGITGGARQIAYDATTCELVQQKDLPNDFGTATAHAIAPLAGWSAAAPLDKVEHLRADNGGQSQKLIRRYDAAGVFIDQLPISSSKVTASDYVAALVHEPIGNQLYLLLSSTGSVRNFRLAVLPRPDGVLTSVDPTVIDLATPCSGFRANFTGTDALGNLYLGHGQPTAASVRVCGFTPTGELLTSYVWTPQGPADANEQYGFLVPGGSHFLLSTTAGKGPSALERGAYQAP